MKPRIETTIAAKQHLCRFPGCNRVGDYSRGLCEPCYRQVAAYVAAGITTWQRLVERGKVRERRQTLKEWILS